MTHVATMGTSSCATIAIGGFKFPTDVGSQEEFEKQYLDNPDSFKGPSDGLSVGEFYSQVIYPTSQPLGRTGDYPFSAMMKAIDNSSLKSKFIIATLNQYQYSEGYWHKKLIEHGFVLTDFTNNSIGSMNYIYVRSPNRPNTVWTHENEKAKVGVPSALEATVDA